MMKDLGGSSKRSKSSSSSNTVSATVISYMFTYDAEKLLDKEKSVQSRMLWW
jgi:hypothetical protein